jgi:hypothetical protein
MKQVLRKALCALVTSLRKNVRSRYFLLGEPCCILSKNGLFPCASAALHANGMIGTREAPFSAIVFGLLAKPHSRAGAGKSRRLESRIVLGCIDAYNSARVGAFFSIFRDDHLRDLHSLALAQTSNFQSSISQNLVDFCKKHIR